MNEVDVSEAGASADLWPYLQLAGAVFAALVAVVPGMVDRLAGEAGRLTASLLAMAVSIAVIFTTIRDLRHSRHRRSIRWSALVLALPASGVSYALVAVQLPVALAIGLRIAIGLPLTALWAATLVHAYRQDVRGWFLLMFFVPPTLFFYWAADPAGDGSAHTAPA